MSLFKKKQKQEQVRTPRRFKIPYEKMEDYCTLSDNLANKHGSDKLERFLLWDFIAALFPEVREGSWSIISENSLNSYVVENLPGKA